MGKIPGKHIRFILIAFLAGACIFSVFKYIVTLKEKYALTDALNQIKTQLSILETEKQGLLQDIGKEKENNQSLTQENAELKTGLETNKAELSQLKADLSQLNKNIEELNSQVSLLKTENSALSEDKLKLQQERAQVVQENDELKARLGSVKELKKAIKEVKKAMRKLKLAPRSPEKLEELKAVEKKIEKIIEGNRGFLLKNGQPTYNAKVKIEVKPAPENKQ